jgi:aspartyl aminopeptidase
MVNMITLFDHEEVGSQSAIGADSNLLVEVTSRIMDKNSKEQLYQAIHSSMMISADMAHAIHPNYPEKHQSSH